MTTAIEVARFILRLAAQEDEPNPITPLQLQKLLYYAQGWYSAYRGGKLFEDDFEAWTYGPVIPVIWQMYNGGGQCPAPDDEACPPAIEDDAEDIIRSVWEGYKDYSPIKLSKKTHDEPPWKEARGDLPPKEPSRKPIPFESIHAFFSTKPDHVEFEGLEPGKLEQAENDLRAGRGVEWEAVLAKSA